MPLGAIHEIHCFDSCGYRPCGSLGRIAGMESFTDWEEGGGSVILPWGWPVSLYW